MFPILFSVGPVTIYTFGVLLAIGFFTFFFFGWRRLRDKGFGEEKIIDLIILLAVFGFWGSRLAAIFFKDPKILLNPSEYFKLGSNPGLSLGGAVLAGALVLGYFTKKHRWDFWRVADELVIAFLPLAVLWQVGSFLSGYPVGRPTGAFWGLFFPGDLIRRQPVALIAALGYLGLWFFLSKIERRWRTWKWYRSGKPGVIALFFLGLGSLGGFLLAFLTQDSLYYLRFLQGLGLAGFAFAFFMIVRRSGLKLGIKKNETDQISR